MDNLLSMRPPAESTILIVDDDPTVIEILSYFLQSEGYQTISAADGKAALNKVDEHNPDVVIMDVMMPKLDGIEACRELKNGDVSRFLPVILMTAREDTNNRILGKDAGADDFLDKPVNELELLVRVRMLLRTRHLFEYVEASNYRLEQRVAERTADLETATQNLAELDRMKSNIIANVSHELRSPLQQIKSSVSLLTLEDLSSRQADEVRITVDGAVESLVNLVEDMISLGKKIELNIGNFVLPHIIQQAVTQINSTHRNRAGDIVLDVDDNLPPVRGDARALSRVLYHLTDNAIKFSRSDSDIRIEARRTANNTVRVAVADEGVGIPQSSQNLIFELFYQIDGSSTRRHPGAGIGLSLVKLVLDGLGVDIVVESEEGRGSIFWFDLDIGVPS